MKVYYEKDADLSLIKGKKVTIVGYGSQGHAHALNLHESGVAVIVGLAAGSKSRSMAEGAGLRVMDVAEAVTAADVIMLALPDTVQKAVYDADIAPNLRPGQLLDGMPRIRHLPGFIVHGRYDVICPVRYAHALADAWRGEFDLTRVAL